ncbi:hypothetical protein BKA59DRAFT_475294 [Fusarium tricinctum]|uniref:DUF4419 domain-containing protein n=1 Tax=Fusarium tricinctum TaxID=61284 RepID=A0A8K0RVH0_9HYPO|nr:hypothetical protein BKA59DRAFT_475294 [Fusarium tricinctum]
MPITFKVVDHPATAWTTASVTSPEDLLKQISPRDFRRSQRIIQTSFDSNTLQDQHISPSENGFVWSAYHAYSQHHHLTIRPEDIWFAILTQISFYINANAEDLRSFFVDHEGRRELEVVGLGDMESANFRGLAKQMAGLISKNVKDPDLGSWVMPSFSTTSDIDQVVASVLFMGAMQKYFSYTMSLTCGIPSVTLLGDISDWRDILGRLDKLEQLGDEPTQFSNMLRPVLKHMILSFEQPDDPNVMRFWNTIATRNPVSSGTDYITGWITAFCFWDDKGKPKRHRAADLLRGVSYPRVKIDSVPVGFASVPVKVNDNGKQVKSVMLAGSFGIRGQSLSENRQVTVSSDGLAKSRGLETLESDLLGIQPLSGWLMYEDEAEGEANARGERMMALRNELDQIDKLPDSDDWNVMSERLHKVISLRGQIEKLEAY